MVAVAAAVNEPLQSATAVDGVAAKGVAVICQDNQASARFELQEAVRKQDAEGICRALAPAMRQGVPPVELEGSLRVLALLVRRSYRRDADAERLGEQVAEVWRRVDGKLDALAEDITTISICLGCVPSDTGPDMAPPSSSMAAWGAANLPLPQQLPAGISDSDDTGLAAMSVAELRASLHAAKLKVDVAAAHLASLQEEAIRRLG